MTRSLTPSSSQRVSSVGIQISLNVMYLGTLRRYQEWNVKMIQVGQFGILLHFLYILQVCCLTFFFIKFTQRREVGVYAFPLGTTTVTDYRRVLLYSTPYCMEAICSNSLRLTCT